MIPKKILNFFEIAAKTATKKNDERNFLLGAVGERADGVLVKSSNGSLNGAPDQTIKNHAEKRLCLKLTPNSVVYVVRVAIGTGEFAMARPCDSCMKSLTSRGVRRIYYTIANNEYGVIDVDKNHERIR